MFHMFFLLKILVTQNLLQDIQPIPIRASHLLMIIQTREAPSLSHLLISRHSSLALNAFVADTTGLAAHRWGRFGPLTSDARGRLSQL